MLKFATEVRREQIAQAVVKLIARHGMKGFNIARLARRVAVAPSAIYHHIKGRDEVLDRLLDLLEKRPQGSVETVHKKTLDLLE